MNGNTILKSVWLVPGGKFTQIPSSAGRMSVGSVGAKVGICEGLYLGVGRDVFGDWFTLGDWVGCSVGCLEG
jgi:hypothetical protein